MRSCHCGPDPAGHGENTYCILTHLLFLSPHYAVLNALQKVVINQMQRPSKPTTIYAYFILKACETAPISRGAINEPIKLMLERMVNAMLTGVFDLAPTKL